jgi:tRNA dimethylallyltransferase
MGYVKADGVCCGKHLWEARWSFMEPLVLLMGPTAVGKTALSLPLAQALQAEILNVDSRQLYRGMDIGTAKPTPAQQAQVPHHLLDLLAPDQPSNAAQFLDAARRALTDVQQRGKRALIVASGGLYLQAVLYGLMPVPSAHEPLRRALHTYADQHGTLALHQRLQRLDPEAARHYHPHDRVRLVRALEVTYLTGEPFSEHRRRHRAQKPLYPYVAVALTREQTDLYARIAARIEAMLEAGWLTEVERLRGQGYTRTCAALNSLGYRELLAYVEGHTPWEETLAAINKATRHLAKRQLTWLRKFPHLFWINLSILDENTAIACILKRLQHPAGAEGTEA